jgi:hypothetical protein
MTGARRMCSQQQRRGSSCTRATPKDQFTADYEISPAFELAGRRCGAKARRGCRNSAMSACAEPPRHWRRGEPIVPHHSRTVPMPAMVMTCPHCWGDRRSSGSGLFIVRARRAMGRQAVLQRLVLSGSPDMIIKLADRVRPTGRGDVPLPRRAGSNPPTARTAIPTAQPKYSKVCVGTQTLTSLSLGSEHTTGS